MHLDVPELCCNRLWRSNTSVRRSNFRHEAIMLQKLSIMLLSSAPKITYYAFKKMPIIPQIMPLILANDVSLLVF